jgi:hypothetical protein
MPSFGEQIDEFTVGTVRVLVRYGCTRRDQYELRNEQPFPDALRERLAVRGVVRGTSALFTVDVAGVHQLTVAPASGRLVIMPRLSTGRAAQRAAAVEVAELVAQTLAEAG